jgi:hypothetical protein
MNVPSPKELARQYRVAKQTLAMHCDLRDSYARLGMGVELLLLIVSALIACTTFAGNDFFRFLRIEPITGRFAFGSAATAAFVGSLVLLLVNPRGKASAHSDAASQWSELVLRFRTTRGENDDWPSEVGLELSQAYVRVNSTAAHIPDAKFNRLKSRYVRKVETSRLKERYPGCPMKILALFCRVRDTFRALKAFTSGAASEGDPPPRSKAD